MSDGVPHDTREEIMEATYRALSDHGVSGLTMQTIADESSLTTGALHYHYDTKEELLVAFLDYLIEQFRQNVRLEEGSPTEQLETITERLLYGPDDYEAFHTALLTLRAEAPYNEAVREAISRNDEEMRALLADIVEHGIETGEFRSVDPEVAAERILTTVDGGLTRRIVLDREVALDVAAESVEAYVRSLRRSQ